MPKANLVGIERPHGQNCIDRDGYELKSACRKPMINKLKFTTAIVLFRAANAFADGHRVKNSDEIEILTAVPRSEVSANNWTNKDVICLSIHGKMVGRMLRSKVTTR